MTHPTPSQITIGNARSPAPFLGCFERAKAKLMAALYVEACRVRGDAWQPLAPRDIGHTLLALVDDPPSWFEFGFGLATPLPPDAHTLVKHGWFTMAGENGPIAPTDLFFEVLARRGHVMGGT